MRLLHGHEQFSSKARTGTHVLCPEGFVLAVTLKGFRLRGGTLHPGEDLRAPCGSGRICVLCASEGRTGTQVGLFLKH